LLEELLRGGNGRPPLRSEAVPVAALLIYELAAECDKVQGEINESMLAYEARQAAAGNGQ
jgi:hypothetical protein